MISKAKPAIAVLFLLVCLIFLSGCETAKGFVQDTKNTWQNVQKADGWMKKNLW